MYQLNRTWIEGHGVLRTEIGACLSLRHRSFGDRETRSICGFFPPSRKTGFLTTDGHVDV